jgi:hypothetical protein
VRAFERQPGESAKAYRAFCCYRDLGAERSLAKAAETYYGSRKNLAQVGLWSRKFDWVDRAQAWDDFVAMIRLDAIEESQHESAADFAARQRALDEKILRCKEKLVERLELMLEFPLSVRQVEREVETEDGKKTEIVHVHPARWSFDTVATLLRVLDRKGAGRIDIGDAHDDGPVTFTLWLGEHEPVDQDDDEEEVDGWTPKW